MEPINKVHGMLKRFLESHGGYSRDELQDWLNLFYLMYNSVGDNSKNAQRFIELAIRKRKNLRYRTWKKSKKFS